MAAAPKQRSRALAARFSVKMRKRKDRTFDRYYEGTDGLWHIVRRHRTVAACGQGVVNVRIWGGCKLVTCLLCLGDAYDRRLRRP